MPIKIDRKLNIVFEILNDDGSSVHVHATPISRPVFEEFFLPISMTFEAIHANNLSQISGPRIAALMLKQVSERLGIWDKVQGGLMQEMVRLTNILVLSNNKWETGPLYDAVKEGFVSEEDMHEIAGILAFFTCVSVMHTRAQVPAFLSRMQLWDVGTTLLTLTEYQNSLPISTPEESTGAKIMAGSSIPS